jgi:hypothetical protein
MSKFLAKIRFVESHCMMLFCNKMEFQTQFINCCLHSKGEIWISKWGTLLWLLIAAHFIHSENTYFDSLETKSAAKRTWNQHFVHQLWSYSGPLQSRKCSASPSWWLRFGPSIPYCQESPSRALRRILFQSMHHYLVQFGAKIQIKILQYWNVLQHWARYDLGFGWLQSIPY